MKRLCVRMSQSDIDDIVRMYCKENCNCSEIAEYIGCYHASVIYHLKRLNLYTPKVKRISNRTLDIVSEYNKGLSYRNIAANYGVSVIAISSLVRHVRQTRPELVTRPHGSRCFKYKQRLTS